MKFSCGFATLALLGSLSLQAEVPELLELVPEAKGYELIAKLNPTRWAADGYQIDRTEMQKDALILFMLRRGKSLSVPQIIHKTLFSDSGKFGFYTVRNADRSIRLTAERYFPLSVQKRKSCPSDNGSSVCA